jgi:creatinine amidohydrolase
MDLLNTATSTDVRDAAPDVAVLPVGSFEQHGGHLPLITDTAIACIIAAAIGEAYSLFVLPPVTISCSHEHADWPGTVSISASTLTAIVDDVRASLEAQGITKLIMVSGHGGNYVLSNIAQQANTAGPRVVRFPTGADWGTARTAAGLDSSGHEDMHGGESETSILLHYQPDYVGPDWQTADHQADDRPDLLLLGMAGYTKTGIIGRPSLATAVKGEALINALVAGLEPHLKLLRGDD